MPYGVDSKRRYPAIIGEHLLAGIDPSVRKR